MPVSSSVRLASSCSGGDRPSSSNVAGPEFGDGVTEPDDLGVQHVGSRSQRRHHMIGWSRCRRGAQCRGEQHLQGPHLLQGLVMELPRPASALLLALFQAAPQAIRGRTRLAGSHVEGGGHEPFATLQPSSWWSVRHSEGPRGCGRCCGPVCATAHQQRSYRRDNKRSRPRHARGDGRGEQKLHITHPQTPWTTCRATSVSGRSAV